MSSECSILVRLVPLEGQLDAVKAAVEKVLEDIRAGAGCLQYDPFEIEGGEIVLFERWESREIWQAHFDTEPIKWLQKELADKVELPVERIELGDSPFPPVAQ